MKNYYLERANEKEKIAAKRRTAIQQLIDHQTGAKKCFLLPDWDLDKTQQEEFTKKLIEALKKKHIKH